MGIENLESVVGGEEHIEMPPLDAGSHSEIKYYEEPTVESHEGDRPSKDDVRPDASPKVEEKQVQEPDDDADILAALDDDAQDGNGLVETPQGVTPEQWKAFQEWTKNQGAAPPPPAKEDVPPAADEFVSQEMFDQELFESPKAINNALGRVVESAKTEVANLEGRMIEHLRGLEGQLMQNIERMIYLAEAAKEHPEVMNYDKAFRKALAKTTEKNPNDLRSQIFDAVDLVQRAVTTRDKVAKTQRIDIRENKSPGAPIMSSSRGLHSGNKQEDDTGLGFLQQIHRR